jgi:predicted dinucleotide-binding enzyme
MSKKIGILGSGSVAQILAGGFIKYGYEVKMGTRDPKKLEEFIQKNSGKISVGSFQEASEFGEIVVLAVKGIVAKSLVEQVKDSLTGKVIIDPTNPIADISPVDGVMNFFSNINLSLMEELQTLAPKAHFVKAFSCIGGHFMVNADFNGVKPSMFICGNDTHAKGEVTQILYQFGFDVEDMGSAVSARAIEPLCMLWCIPGIKNNSWSHAFKLLRK